jgi:hypothetical protein
MVLAVLALVFAMVGTAVAGTDGLTSKITKSKVKSIAKKQADKELKANVSGSHVNTADTATNATNANTAANATNLNGQSASAFASSASAVRYVTVLGDGTIVPAETKGVTQANVTHPGTGIYCVNGLSPAPNAVSISRVFSGGFARQQFAQINPTVTQVCAGLQIGVATYSDANGNTFTNDKFMLTILTG